MMAPVKGVSLRGLEARIAVAEMELEEMRRAAAVMRETLALHPAKPEGLCGRQALEIEVNGVMLPVGTKQAVALRLLGETPAPACVPEAALRAVFGGTIGNYTTSISKLRAKLKAANAEIVFFRGEGYRLQVVNAIGAE